jgi:chemotaxis protein methyltransferase CheR
VNRVSELLEAGSGCAPSPPSGPGCGGHPGRGRRPGLGLEHYLDTVVAGGPVLQQLLNRITVQETSFFRHPEHFDVLAREVLPG